MLSDNTCLVLLRRLVWKVKIRLVCIIWLLTPGFLGVIPPCLLSLGHPNSSDGDEDEEDKEEEEKADEGEERGEGETRGGIGLHCTQGGRRRGGRGGGLLRKASL